MAEINEDNFWRKGYIRVSGVKDREELSALLIRQGYTPRFVRRRLKGSKNFSYFIEYRYKPIDLSDDDIFE